MPLRIKNARVLDPKNKILGQRADVEMQGGKIVEKITGGDVEELDAGGRFVVPAGIDPHAHLASNVARFAGIYSKEWTSKTISEEYLRAGYTFAASADVSLFDVLSTSHFLRQIKGVDSGILLSAGSLWMLALDFQQGNTDNIAATLAYFGAKLLPLAIHVSRPFSSEYWHWGDENASLQTPVKHFEVPPEKVIIETLKAAKRAGFSAKSLVELPHDNQTSSFAALKDHLTRIDSERLPYHLIQGQCHAQVADTTGGAPLATLLSEHPWLSMDAGCGAQTGQTLFATTSRTLGHKSIARMRGTFELDQDIGVGLRAWNLQNSEEARLWIGAIEFLLSAGERHLPAAISFDAPNFGMPRDFGQILTLLASRSFREKQAKTIVGQIFNKSALKTMATELRLEDLIQMTRVTPAKVLGIDAMKGHLAPGADADACILDLKPDDPIREASLSRAWVTIKSGQIVLKNDTLHQLPPSKFFASKINSDIVTEDVVQKREKWFQKYSSINMASLLVPPTDQLVKV